MNNKITFNEFKDNYFYKRIEISCSNIYNTSDDELCHRFYGLYLIADDDKSVDDVMDILIECFINEFSKQCK